MLYENDDDFEVIKSDQEDDGGYDRYDNESDSFALISSQRSTTVNHETLKDFESDENMLDLLIIYNDDFNNQIESYNYGLNYNKLDTIIEDTIIEDTIIEDTIIEDDDCNMYMKMERIKKLFLNIYLDLFTSIFGYKLKTDDILFVLNKLNQYFIDQKISQHKFQIILFDSPSFYYDIIKYLDTEFYSNIIKLINKNNESKCGPIFQYLIDNYIYKIEQIIYEKLFLNYSILSPKNYWDLKYNFIEDLSLIFNIKINENYYSIIT